MQPPRRAARAARRAANGKPLAWCQPADLAETACDAQRRQDLQNRMWYLPTDRCARARCRRPNDTPPASCRHRGPPSADRTARISGAKSATPSGDPSGQGTLCAMCSADMSTSHAGICGRAAPQRCGTVRRQHVQHGALRGGIRSAFRRRGNARRPP